VRFDIRARPRARPPLGGGLDKTGARLGIGRSILDAELHTLDVSPAVENCPSRGGLAR
jgi:hypothetical protein